MHKWINKSVFMFSMAAVILCSCATKPTQTNLASEYPGGEVYSTALKSDGWKPDEDIYGLQMKYIIQTSDSTVVIATGLKRQNFKYSVLMDHFYIEQKNGTKRRMKYAKGMESDEYHKIIVRPNVEVQLVFEKVDASSKFSIYGVSIDFYRQKEINRKTRTFFSSIDLTNIKGQTGTQFID